MVTCREYLVTLNAVVGVPLISIAVAFLIHPRGYSKIHMTYLLRLAFKLPSALTRLGFKLPSESVSEGFRSSADDGVPPA